MAERRELDAYQTPPALARAICRRLAALIPTPSLIVEPSAGQGAFVAGARAAWPDAPVLAVDADARCAEPCAAVGALNFLEGDWVERSRDVRHGPGPMLILGNPPYSKAQAHIEAALAIMRPGDHLALLLRLAFLCGQARTKTLWARPGFKYLLPIAQRPSFTGNGATDGSEYAVFLWQRPETAQVLPHVWVDEDDEEAAA